MSVLEQPRLEDKPPRRFFHMRDVEWKDSGNGKDFTFEGLAVPFNSWSELLETPIGCFRERFLPGAFAEVLAQEPDVRFLKNHDKNFVLARTKSGTLKLWESERGLEVWARVAPTSYAKDLRLSMDRKDIDQMSVQFELDYEAGAKSNWREDKKTGEVQHEVARVTGIRDVTIATFPAYIETAAAMRTLDGAIERGLVRDTQDTSSTKRTYSRCLQVVSEAAWLIKPAYLVLIREILNERASGFKPTDEQIRERIGVQRDNEPTVSGGTAIVPMVGPVLSRAGAMSRVSAAKSLDIFRDEFRQALADPAVSSIVLDIDSPGGTADMVPEMAAEIFAARETKPIVAVANAMAASAAYWLGSAASELVVTPSGEVGSIGVYAGHEDMSQRLEDEGIDVTLVSAGKYKTEGNPFEPLSDEAKAEMQRGVDAIYGDFVSAVAKYRGTSNEDVLENFGQGRVVIAKDALKAGMVDRIETIDQTLARLGKSTQSREAQVHVDVHLDGREIAPLIERQLESREALSAALGLTATPDEPAGTSSVTQDEPAGDSDVTPEDPAGCLSVADLKAASKGALQEAKTEYHKAQRRAARK